MKKIKRRNTLPKRSVVSRRLARAPHRRSWTGRIATEERWERMVQMVQEEIREGRRTPKTPLYLTEEACWKGNVYTFVLNNTQNNADSHSLSNHVEDLILGQRGKRLPPLLPSGSTLSIGSCLLWLPTALGISTVRRCPGLADISSTRNSTMFLRNF